MSEPVVFDKAKWHSDGEFPEDLDEDQAFVHTGLYLGWVIDNHLFSEEFADDMQNEIGQFKSRKLTGPEVYAACDGVFIDDQLSEDGLAFTTEYFDFENGKFLKDYEKLFPGLPSMYHVQDTWENYNKLKPVIDKRYAAWKKKNG
jgi:hypothetical protein